MRVGEFAADALPNDNKIKRRDNVKPLVTASDAGDQIGRGHELIVRGPYRLVRHPIYTGLLTMVVATAIPTGHIAGVIGFILIFVSLWIKSSYEEEVMRKQFPAQYAAYRERVKRIIPSIL